MKPVIYEREECRYCAAPISIYRMSAHMPVCPERPIEAPPCTAIEDELWGHIKPMTQARAGRYINRKAIIRALRDGLTNNEIATTFGVAWATVKDIRREHLTSVPLLRRSKRMLKASTGGQ